MSFWVRNDTLHPKRHFASLRKQKCRFGCETEGQLGSEEREEREEREECAAPVDCKAVLFFALVRKKCARSLIERKVQSARVSTLSALRVFASEQRKVKRLFCSL